jgi:hypothetical protein
MSGYKHKAEDGVEPEHSGFKNHFKVSSRRINLEGNTHVQEINAC